MVMEEIRKDPIVGEWVIVSAARAKRPSDYNKPSHGESRADAGDELARKQKQGPCHFCGGQEHETGAELFAIRGGGGGKIDGSSSCLQDWRVRVVRNIYPALSVDAMDSPYVCGGKANTAGERGDEDEDEDEDGGDREHGLYHASCMPGFGSHEVVIETPYHDLRFTHFSPLNVSEVLMCFRQRMQILRDDGRFRYVQVFKNKGKAAGASMEHSHSQIIALPIVPHNVQHEIDCAKSYFDKKGSCVYCDILQHGISEGSRLIGCSTDYAVLIPYAPRYPYETWIVPQSHSSSFEDTDDDGLKRLGETLLQTMRKIEHLFGEDVSFNYMVRTSPVHGYRGVPFYHWYIRIIPRLITLAGFELGSGCHILPVFPEKSASELREANPPIS